MRNIAYNLVLFWAALNTVFPFNSLLEKLDALGFGWLSIFELVYVSPAEYVAIHLVTGLFIVVLGLLNRFSLSAMLICCGFLGILIVANRLVSCSVLGNAQAFEALYLDGSFDLSLCLYYASLNFLTAVVKVFYFVGVFGLLRWVVNRLTGFRFMPEREQS